jgi:large-conductance mechanosensitive channel
MSESNFIYYVVGFIVIAHFVIGFGVLAYKINKAPSSKSKEQEEGQGD